MEDTSIKGEVPPFILNLYQLLKHSKEAIFWTQDGEAFVIPSIGAIGTPTQVTSFFSQLEEFRFKRTEKEDGTIEWSHPWLKRDDDSKLHLFGVQEGQEEQSLSASLQLGEYSYPKDQNLSWMELSKELFQGTDYDLPHMQASSGSMAKSPLIHSGGESQGGVHLKATPSKHQIQDESGGDLMLGNLQSKDSVELIPPSSQGLSLPATPQQQQRDSSLFVDTPTGSTKFWISTNQSILAEENGSFEDHSPSYRPHTDQRFPPAQQTTLPPLPSTRRHLALEKVREMQAHQRHLIDINKQLQQPEDAQNPSIQGLNDTSLNKDPFEQFRLWFSDAQRDAFLPHPEAMTLSTCTKHGFPSARMVLLKSFDERGFVFFSNYKSKKSCELEENPRAALTFYWPRLDRSVRIEGEVEKTSADESTEYFVTRPRESQLGAWVSLQSAPLSSRKELDLRFEEVKHKFRDINPIPRPEFWGGWRVKPLAFEFWQNGAHRLHDRFTFTRKTTTSSSWEIQRLYP